MPDDNPTVKNCEGLPDIVIRTVCAERAATGSVPGWRRWHGAAADSGPADPIPSLPLGRCRHRRGLPGGSTETLDRLAWCAYDPDLVGLLLPGVADVITRRPRCSCWSSRSSPCSASPTSAPATPGSTRSSSTTPTPSSPHFRSPAASSPAPRSPTAASLSARSRRSSCHRRRRRRLLDIDNNWDDIPGDAVAVVGNRSAVGEQYVDLQPKTDEGPYLAGGLRDRPGRHPDPDPHGSAPAEDISTTTVVGQQGRLRTVISEIGLAFDGTGDDLGQIIDTSNSFIETANANFDTTDEADQGQQHRPQDAARLGVVDPQLHQRPGAVQHHGRRRGPRPAQRHRQRLGARPTSCGRSSRRTGSTSPR